MATKKQGKIASKKKMAKKVIKLKQPKVVQVARISGDEAIFRDMMEFHFGILDIDYLASLYRAVQRFSLTVSELNQAHGFHILDVVSFKNLEGE